MANHKSALKRIKQNQLKKMRNRAGKTRVKNVSKDFRAALANKENTESVPAKFKAAQSQIDKAAKKGIIHKKAASRRISRLSKLSNKTNTLSA